MHRWYIIAIFAVCEIRTANLFWRDFFFPVTENLKIWSSLILTFGQAKVMRTDIRKNLILRCLIYLDKKQSKQIYKKGQNGRKIQPYFLCHCATYFPHVRHENRQDQTEEQRNIKQIIMKKYIHKFKWLKKKKI